MTSFGVDIATGKIDWGRRTGSGEALLQRTAITLATRKGTDRILPDRGTELLVRLSQARAFDSITLQHELNFAALSARRSVRAYETGENAEDLVGNVLFTLATFEGGKATADLVVTDSAGTSTALTYTL